MSTFIEQLKERAKKDIKTIVLAEGEEIRTLKAAEMVKKEGYAKIILVGNTLILTVAKVLTAKTVNRTKNTQTYSMN